MKEARFVEPSDQTWDTIDQMRERFIGDEKGYFTREEVKAFAQEIAQGIQETIPASARSDEQVYFVFQMLDAVDLFQRLEAWGYRVKRLDLPPPNPFAPPEQNEQGKIPTFEERLELSWEHAGKPHTATLTLHELESFLAPIREAVLEELKNVLDSSTLLLLKKELHEGRVWEAYDARVLKEAKDVDPRTHPEPQEHKRARFAATSRLFELPERSPYLAYHVVALEHNFDSRRGAEVQRKLDIQTLNELTLDNIPLEASVRAVIDAMRGAAFLVEHGLRLTDFAPDNIMVDTATGTGMLFDYDGLREHDDIVDWYPAHRGFLPPERISLAEKQRLGYQHFTDMLSDLRTNKIEAGVITQAEMVYEFGSLLLVLLYRAPYESMEKFHEDIKRFGIPAMRAEDPKARPTLAQAIEHLEAIVAELDQKKDTP